MAIQTTAQIQAKIDAYFVAGGGITAVELNEVCTDLNDSKEPLFQQYTTVQRDALTPFEGQKIYNTTSNRCEYYSASQWTPFSQKETVAIDCSANPNYPEALVGDQYIVSVAGYVGGASGKAVYVGDIVYCIDDNAGGTEASVGTDWSVCHSQSATDNPTFYAEISLSSAQILALNSTPITVVAAPGAGKIILPMDFVFNYTHVTTAYNAQTLQAKFAAGSTGLGIICPSLATVVANQIISGEVNQNVAIDRMYSNSALQAWASANPTTGDGTATFGVYYKIHTL